MVNSGSGGAFSGITYLDEEGNVRTGADYILNRLSIAQINQYKEIFYAQREIACVRPTARQIVI